MRIGEIAKRVNIPVNSVRYYINMGLLVPQNKNKQYIFNDDDLKDLELIIKLKSLHFSLNDIHKILSLSRVSNLNDRGDIEDYLKFFLEQKDRLVQERTDLEKAISGIKNEIDHIKNSIENHSLKTGVPLSMLSKIYCPHCQKQLNLKDAYIENQYVLSGEFLCDCGYTAKIKDGIICTKGGWISSYDYPDLDRSFMKNIPAPFVSALQKSYNWMLEQLTNIPTDDMVLFEDHMNAYAFSYRHIAQMNPRTKYILADKYFEIVKMYKDRIDRLNLNLDILYICDATFELPLKQNCVDIFIDYFSSNEYNFFNHHYLLDTLGPYFHSNTNILGTYFYFKPGSRSMKQAILDYPETWDKNFDHPSFKKHFIGEARYNSVDEEPMGYVTDSGSSDAFTFHLQGEEMHLHSYNWLKK
ncbi:MAG: MerR family transcriptional regulator [Bacillota bacterium]|jgi:DNA-binding transcriptional MerR regulator